MSVRAWNIIIIIIIGYIFATIISQNKSDKTKDMMDMMEILMMFVRYSVS